jgi:predicted enzyme related to lactoylglutathione lyase
MEGKVVNLTLVVKNQAKALEFYTNQAGFEKKTDLTGPGGYHWVTVGLKGQELEFALFEMGSGVDPETKERTKHLTPGASGQITIQVPDCRKAYEELNKKGVKFLNPPADHPWGTVAVFADPDGNVFAVSQLKAWSPPK